MATDIKQPIALNNLAALLAKTGQIAEALTLSRQAVSLYPQDPNFRDTVGWIAFLNGNQEEAQLHLGEAIRLDPKQGMSHYHLAKVFLAQNHLPEANECLRHALECSLADDTRREIQKILSGK